MPTLRRYCRVSKYTVLECRIYLDNPADLNPWLLSPRYNILPRIFASAKPLVLPKLQEEWDRAKVKGAKGKKGAAVKDVIVEDDFEVSLFLTNSGTRHAVMTKRKTLRAAPPKILSNSSKLTGSRDSVTVEIRREPSEDDPIRLDAIPAASTPTFVVPDDDQGDGGTALEPPGTHRNTRSKRRKRKPPTPLGGGRGDSSDSDPYEPRLKCQKIPTITIPDSPSGSLFAEDPKEGEGDDKKKLGLQTEYEGFNIHSRILCIVVKRRGTAGRRTGTAATTVEVAGKGKIMEEWINMSQAIKDGDGGEVE